MRDMENLPRLCEADDAPAELRTLLRRASEDVSSPAQAQELVRSVEIRMAAPHGTFEDAGRPRVRTTFRVLAGLAVLGVGIGAWYLAGQTRPEEPPSAETITSEPVPTSAAVASDPLDESRPPAAVAPVVSVEKHPAPTDKRRHVATARVRGQEHDTVHRTSVTTVAEPVSRESSDEFALLRAARQAITDRPARALALTEEHAKKFPSGMLTQERETIAVEALAKLGRGAQAQVRANAFLKAHADSPYRNRIEVALRRISEAKLRR